MEESFSNRTEGIIKGRYYGKLKEIIENAIKKKIWYPYSLIYKKKLNIIYIKIVAKLTICLLFNI